MAGNGHGDDGVDVPDFKLDNLFANEDPPNLATLARLSKDLRRKVMTDNDLGPNMTSVLALMKENAANPDGLNYTEFAAEMTKNHILSVKLFTFASRWDQRGAGVVAEVRKVADVLTALQPAVASLGTLFRCLDPTARQTVPGELANDDVFEKYLSTFVSQDEKELKNFQNAHLYLIGLLDSLGYRRKGESFFSRVETASGISTMAFEEKQTIEAFVHYHCSNAQNPKAYKWSTDPPANTSHLIRFLTEGELWTAPPLAENKDLTSYEGDECGLGAGIYNCRYDMFFPYLCRSEWPRMARIAKEVRRRFDSQYDCEPPDETDVAVIHLGCEFPFNILEELLEDRRRPLGIRWRAADPFECTWGGVELGGPDATDAEKEIATTFGERLAGALPESEPDAPLLNCGGGTTWFRLTDPTAGDADAHWALGSDQFELDYGDPVVERVAKEVFDVAGKELRVDLISFDPHEAPGPPSVPCGSVIRFFVKDGVRVHSQGPGVHEVRFATTPRPKMRARADILQKARSDAPEDRKRLKGLLKKLDAASGLEWKMVRDLNDKKKTEKKTEKKIDIRTEHRTFGERIKNDRLSRALRTKTVFTQQEWDELGVTDEINVNSYVVLGTKIFKPVGEIPVSRNTFIHYQGRYFRPHMGRTWRDCACEPIDRIYNCQKFCDHDRFFLYALKGRTFFDIGELESCEGTLMYEGIGGSGKSTALKALMCFKPAHRRGHISSNMQKQFGMSDVAHTDVVFCNEVGQDMQIPQEEWQGASSGEVGSYAVKFKKPLTCKWKPTFVWAGNGPPPLDNSMGQVTRRLYGVHLRNPVRPRDGTILKQVEANLGFLQRKMLLAFLQDWVRMFSVTEPISAPDSLLAPAFAEYYVQSRRNSNPFLDFLQSGKFVVVDPGSKVRWIDLGTWYKQFRAEAGLQAPVQRLKDIALTIFAEYGASLCFETPPLGGAPVEVVYGLRSVVPDPHQIVPQDVAPTDGGAF